MDTVFTCTSSHMGRAGRRDRLRYRRPFAALSDDTAGSAHARTDTARPYAYGIRHHALWAAYVWSNAAYHAFLYVHCIDGGDHGHRQADHVAGTGAAMDNRRHRPGLHADLHLVRRPARFPFYRQGANADYRSPADRPDCTRLGGKRRP